MQTYTAIIFSILLLLGSATTSNALETENEIQSTFAFFSGSAQTSQSGNKRPSKGGNIRAFVQDVCNSRPDDIETNCPHRGSGR